MLIIECEMGFMHIKIDGFMIRGLVSEAETVDPFLLSHKLKLLTRLVMKITNLVTRRSLYLVISAKVASQSCHVQKREYIQVQTIGDSPHKKYQTITKWSIIFFPVQKITGVKEHKSMFLSSLEVKTISLCISRFMKNSRIHTEGT